MITNAEHHRRLEKKGEWRTAHKVIRCSHYFGDLASCDRAIAPGRRYFDTNEKVPDAGIRFNEAEASCLGKPQKPAERDAR